MKIRKYSFLWWVRGIALTLWSTMIVLIAVFVYVVGF